MKAPEQPHISRPRYSRNWVYVVMLIILFAWLVTLVYVPPREYTDRQKRNLEIGPWGRHTVESMLYLGGSHQTDSLEIVLDPNVDGAGRAYWSFSGTADTAYVGRPDSLRPTMHQTAGIQLIIASCDDVTCELGRP